MKLHRLIATAVALPALMAFGFDAAHAITWQIGLKGGVNEAKLRGDPVSLWLGEGESQLAGVVDNYKTGFIGGAYATAYFSEAFGIETDILYTQRGGKGPVAGYAPITPPNDVSRLAEFEGTLSVHLDYVEMHVLAFFSFEPDEESRFNLRAYAGPTFGINTSAEMQLTGRAYLEMQDTGTRWVQVDERMAIGQQVKDFEFGALIGFSVSYELDKVDLFLDARWGRGFTTLDNTVNTRSTFNSGIAFLGGFSVPIGD